MNKQVVKWSAGALTIAALASLVAAGAIRLNKAEEQAQKVAGIEREVHVICITLKLIAPEKFKQAEELAK